MQTEFQRKVSIPKFDKILSKTKKKIQFTNAFALSLSTEYTHDLQQFRVLTEYQ